MAGYDLSDYVDVAARLKAFFALYPDGSLQATPPRVVELDGKRYIEVIVEAYRNPADTRPSRASAWEVWPGRTSYTRDSEPMNAETSAAGRALAFLGLEVRRSVSTVDEIRNRELADRTPKVDKARVARIRALLKDLADTVKAKQELVELILGHSTGGLADLTVEEGEAVEGALGDLAAGRTRRELDESGAPRIVTVEGGTDAEDNPG